MKRDGVELELERQDKAPLRNMEYLAEMAEENSLKQDFEKHRSSVVSQTVKQEEEGASLFVTAPMVGTLYHTPSPQ